LPPIIGRSLPEVSMRWSCESLAGTLPGRRRPGAGHWMTSWAPLWTWLLLDQADCSIKTSVFSHCLNPEDPSPQLGNWDTVAGCCLLKYFLWTLPVSAEQITLQWNAVYREFSKCLPKTASEWYLQSASDLWRRSIHQILILLAASLH